MPKIAILSDIHGNLAALEAVMKDLEDVRPDVVLHGGDIAYSGPRPAECIDLVRSAGWPGVKGNCDDAVAGGHVPLIRRMVFGPLSNWARQRIGDERVRWLAALPMEHREGALRLVHAVPGNLWKIVGKDAPDSVLRKTYSVLEGKLAVYGHIHTPYVRDLGDFRVANCGSVGLPADGDPRAAYLVVNDEIPEVRRVAYDVERAVADLKMSGLPTAGVVERVYRNGQAG